MSSKHNSQPNAGSTLVHYRRLWLSTIHWTVLSVGGGVSRVQADTIQCLLNVGSASPVLASIHSALVSTSCWRESINIVYTTPMLFKGWPASYTMARHWTNVRYTDTLPGQWWACVAWTIPARCLEPSWVNVGPSSVTLAHIQCDTKHNPVTQYWANAGSASYLLWNK